jgi:5-amino-6-(5-phospho-D-ribitylamino)uracil phosphatase
LNGYRMVITDLDKTLLRSDETISPYTLSVLRRCNATGVKIVFATNRSYRRVLGFLDDAPCDAVVCHKGAAVYVGGEKLTDLCIQTETAQRLLRGLNDRYPHMPLIADSDETLFANIDVAAVFPGLVAVQTDFHTLPGRPVEIVSAGIDCDETLEELRTFLPEGLYAQKLHDRFIFIMEKRATKQNALELLSARLGINLKKAVCFGDDRGDIEMLSAAGRGVAVQNAGDAVKAAADDVTEENDKDGVAHYLEKLLFGE